MIEIKNYALKYFTKHWSKEVTAINIPRTNIIAECGAKMMEELLQNSKKREYANVKFIGKNDL